VVHAIILTKLGAAFQSARVGANFGLAKYLSGIAIELRSVAGRNTKVGLLGLDSFGTGPLVCRFTTLLCRFRAGAAKPMKRYLQNTLFLGQRGDG